MVRKGIPMRKNSWLLVAPVSVLLVFLFLKAADAMCAMPLDLPAERLVANLEAIIKDHPKDAGGYARLARVQATLFLDRITTLHEWDLRANAMFAPQPGKDVTDDDAQKYGLEAAKNFAKAIELDPKNGMYHLNVAYFLEHGADQAATAPYGLVERKPTAAEAADFERLIKFLASDDEKARKEAHDQLVAFGNEGKTVKALVAHLKDANPKIATAVQKLLGNLWKEQAIVYYWKAYELTIDADIKEDTGTFGGSRPISTEAAAAYEGMVGARTAGDAEKKNLATIKDKRDELAKAQAAKMNGPNGGPMMVRSTSPIIFSLDAAKPLHQLLAANKMVPFDLDGDDVVELRAWVKGDTAILVWDPAGTGKIASGRQLFGNVTWWIFWDNGYQAMDALDDNRDGQLTGAELTGLCVWRDANQNGISDPGEVEPVVNVGIDSISVRASSTEDGCPANSHGLHLASGKTLPTYDWYAPGVKP